MVGGNWNNGSNDGPWYVNWNYAPSNANWNYGARLLLSAGIRLYSHSRLPCVRQVIRTLKSNPRRNRPLIGREVSSKVESLMGIRGN